MRQAFFDAVFDLATRDSRVHLVVGDLGFGVVERFAAERPQQFINAGIAEQTMIGLSAGLALEGAIVFAYSIGNFPTLRALEQLRNDVCYHRLSVTVVTVGGGLAYGALGPSHHATEDLAIMRTLPNLTVVAPGDPHEASELTRACATGGGPCYLRLGRAGEARLHPDGAEITLGRAATVRSGSDGTIISTGGMLETALAAADLLAAEGLQCRILSMHTLKPLDVDAVLAASRTGAIVTLEEHSIIGGLGGAVSEVLAETPLARPVPFSRVGLPAAFMSGAGSQEYFRARHGLTAEAVATRVQQLLLQSAHFVEELS